MDEKAVLLSPQSQSDRKSGNGAYSSQDLLEKARVAEAISVPAHVAIIMDGNGRWAKARRLPRIAGHRAGAKSVRMVVEEARLRGIRCLTLFSFSTENWFRPEGEVSALMGLFCQYLESELELLLKSNIRLRAIGDGKLPQEVRAALQRTIDATRDADGMDLVLALSYGGREEIAHAARTLAEQVRAGELDPGDITPALISQNLYAPDLPEPDLLIRTSNEYRISNFLLWQLAYSEIVVSPVLWPDFSKEELDRCLSEYANRTRRFGLTDEQIAP